MEILEPPIQTEHPPHAEKENKKGRLLPRLLLKVTLVLVFSLSFIHLPHLISVIQDIAPGIKYVIPGVETERDKMIKEILVILERQQSDLASVTREALAEAIYDEALRYNHDPKLILACIATESSFKNWAVSERGAKGLMQIMPDVAESLAKKLDIEWTGDRTLFNPFLNLKMGIFYLSELIRDFHDLGTALTAYNYGPTRVRSLLEKRQRLPLDYYNRILTTYQSL